jgi:hypothetical protein
MSETVLWPLVARTFTAPAAVVDLAWHDYDQSVELFFARETPAGWLPSEAALKAVVEAGAATVYCVFADETEVVAGFRPGAAGRPPVWVMSPKREPTGTVRYGSERGQVRILRGADAALWPEFLAWKAAKG